MGIANTVWFTALAALFTLQVASTDAETDGSTASGVGIVRGPLFGADYMGMDMKISYWNSSSTSSKDHYHSVMLKCENNCNKDAECCAWTYVMPGGDPYGERCCLKSGLPPLQQSGNLNSWTGAPKRASLPACQQLQPQPAAAQPDIDIYVAEAETA